MPDDRPRLVITGCARSGTNFIAAVVSELGIPCTHEAVFHPYLEHFAGFGDAPAESSWLAAPFVRELPADTVVIHQVREPVDVVRSLLGLRFFSLDGSSGTRNLSSLVQIARARGVAGIIRRLRSSDRWERGRRLRSHFVDFATTHCPSILDEPTEVDRCFRYWVDWNRMIENGATDAGLTLHRVRLGDRDPERLAGVLAPFRPGLSADDVVAALAAVPSDKNTRPYRSADAPEPTSDGLGRDVDELVSRYGLGG